MAASGKFIRGGSGAASVSAIVLALLTPTLVPLTPSFAAGPSARKSAAPRWQYSQSKDAMTDKLEVLMTKLGVNGEMAILCGGGKNVIFMFRTKAVLRYSQSDENILIRFDAEPAEEYAASIDAHEVNIGGPLDQSVVDAMPDDLKSLGYGGLALRKALTSGRFSRMRVRLPTIRGDMDLVFDVSDARAPLQRLIAACAAQ